MGVGCRDRASLANKTLRRPRKASQWTGGARWGCILAAFAPFALSHSLVCDSLFVGQTRHLHFRAAAFANALPGSVDLFLVSQITWPSSDVLAFCVPTCIFLAVEHPSFFRRVGAKLGREKAPMYAAFIHCACPVFDVSAFLFYFIFLFFRACASGRHTHTDNGGHIRGNRAQGITAEWVILLILQAKDRRVVACTTWPSRKRKQYEYSAVCLTSYERQLRCKKRRYTPFCSSRLPIVSKRSISYRCSIIVWRTGRKSDRSQWIGSLHENVAIYCCMLSSFIWSGGRCYSLDTEKSACLSRPRKSHKQQVQDMPAYARHFLVSCFGPVFNIGVPSGEGFRFSPLALLSSKPRSICEAEKEAVSRVGGNGEGSEGQKLQENRAPARPFRLSLKWRGGDTIFVVRLGQGGGGVEFLKTKRVTRGEWSLREK